MKKIAVLVLALLIALTATALADFPEKQITVVCPYGAGGASDTTSRIYGSMLQLASLSSLTTAPAPTALSA